ncbi:lysosomal proton-coupled steroid conjugate and bile acid symporter SLC46A3-like [Ylistrum balloti]|uniref:lysosomal proton-coupled steroid conjugate and bile acid symporter SLC46A3-like n=1 Tax=Ylistrum balloti TaxID=509963 RepID=UPI002905DC3E|nr:lysosomal proton-coupled steroid conjugate and bile acid symporter SLC46A3-like [Ylistrum balloti]
MDRRQNYSLQPSESKEPLPLQAVYAVSDSTDNKWSNNADNQNVAEIKTGKRTMGRFMLLLFIMVSLIYSFILAQLVTTQYMYAYIRRDRFPNVSFSSNESKCEINITSQLFHDQQTVQKLAAQLNIYLDLAKGIPGTLSIFLYGSFSDRYGRKIILLIPFIANMLKCILITLGTYLNWNIYVFIIFSFIDGVGGGWVLAMSIVMSMVADITEPGKTRTFAIAMTELSLGFGLIIGGFTSGFIIRAKGFTYVLVISSCCSLVPILLLIFVQETLRKPKDDQRKSVAKLAVDIYVFYFRDISINGKRKIFLVCMVIYFLNIQAAIGSHGIETLYGLNSPFCWSSVEVGNYAAINHGLPFVTGMLLFRPLQWCLEETLIAVLAVLSNFTGMVLEALSYTTLMLFFVPVLSFARTMAVPVLRGVMSRLTPQDKQGSMFGGMAIVETFCSLFGGVASNAIYGETVDTFRGTAFLVLAAYLFLGFLLAILLHWFIRRLNKDKPMKGYSKT